MNNDNFGFGEPAANLIKHGNHKPYTQMELHILRALFLSCNCKAHYYRAGLFFCEACNRLPAELRKCYIEKGLRVPAEEAARLTENVLYRRVWGMVLVYPKNRDVVFDDFSREDLPISYIEGTKFIRAWRTTKRKKPSLQRLAMLLGRKTTNAIDNCNIITLREIMDNDPLAKREALLEIVHKLTTMKKGDERILNTWQHFNSTLLGD